MTFLVSGCWRAAGAPQDGLDAGLDLQNIERLGHIVVRAVFQPENLIDVLALGGEHDDGHVAVLADALATVMPSSLGSITSKE
jgi:hypothetical protein